MSTIEVKKIGITKLKVDAIVNAANESLYEGGGVCGAIFSEAGSSDLADACSKYGHCDTGSAVITPGFNLPAKYIIHAVGPRWHGGEYNEPQLLYSAYKQSLVLAKYNNCHSIAFPLISSGIFGYPKDKAWKKAVQACIDFQEKNQDYELNIIFAVLSDDMLSLGRAILKEEQLKHASKSQPELTPDEKKALYMWTMGLGDMNKLLKGESPIPEKKEKATADSWNIQKMPEKNITIPAQIPVSKESMDILRMGHIPEVQEDHWFMYCDNQTVRYFRSWTGICVYIAHYQEIGDGQFVIDQITINRDPEQYAETDASADFDIFCMLIESEIGGNPDSHWENFFEKKADDEITPGKYRHYKGNEYEVIGVAKHSETEEAMVVYRALYGDYGLWVRPAKMWNEHVTVNGKSVKRFTKIKE